MIHSPCLLAVDLGLKMGYALYDRNGRLLRYQARKISGRSQLKTFIHSIFKDCMPSVVHLEGGGPVAELWCKQAAKRDVPVRQVHAEAWREDVLHQRQRRTGKDAKRHAIDMATRIIEWSAAKRPTSMRHDLAEAIVFGLWAVVQEGWLEGFPKEILKS